MEITRPATLRHHCDRGLVAMRVCSPATALSRRVASAVVAMAAVGGVGVEGEPVDDAVGEAIREPEAETEMPIRV